LKESVKAGEACCSQSLENDSRESKLDCIQNNAEPFTSHSLRYRHFCQRISAIKAWLRGRTSKAATAIPSGIIQKPRIGKKPNTPLQISNNPSTSHSPRGTESLIHSITLSDWPLIHAAVPCGSVLGDGSCDFILIISDRKQRCTP